MAASGGSGETPSPPLALVMPAPPLPQNHAGYGIPYVPIPLSPSIPKSAKRHRSTIDITMLTSPQQTNTP